jgi:hypothetical protein
MHPWDIKGSDDTKLEAWLKLLPEDYCFAIYDEMRQTVVCITPVSYFDATGTMYKDSIPMFHILPAYLIETFEGIYETDKSANDVYRDMLAAGFVHNAKFQSFMEGGL